MAEPVGPIGQSGQSGPSRPVGPSEPSGPSGPFERIHGAGRAAQSRSAPAGAALALILLLRVGAGHGAADAPTTLRAAAPRHGQPISAAAAQAQDLTVFPDGSGLPPGRGTAAQGQPLFEARCAACHGAGGTGGTGGGGGSGSGSGTGSGSSGRLVGRAPLGAAPWPDKTIGQYWPQASTVFDYIRRAMPWGAPGSLSADEVYALTAWLLNANGVIGADVELNALTLPAVRMPNRDGFVRSPH